MNAGDESGRDYHALELVERRLAEFRHRMKELRALESSFAPGSPERIRATTLLEEVEVLHQVLDELCRQFRRRMAFGRKARPRGDKPDG
jgi:hypothetical protein